MATVASTPETHGNLVCCASCNQTLPLRPAKPGEQASDWVCGQCGDVCTAVYAEKAPRELATRAMRHRGAAKAKQAPPAAPAVITKPLASRAAPPASEHTSASQSLDRATSKQGGLQVDSAGPAFLQSITKPTTAPYSEEAVQRLSAQQDQSIVQLGGLIRSLEKGGSIDGEAHESITRDTLSQAAEDLDLFVRLGINSMGGGYPGDHTLHVAMLASAIGANMGWDHQTLVDLGVGCLIHDIGMVDKKSRVFEAPRVLEDAEFAPIINHPLRTFDLLEDHFSRIPLASRMVAYQMHERPNGEGYPRKRRGPLIHEAAKVAALADVYVALVSPRPHREPMMPYHAVRSLLEDTRRGAFDPSAVRALLKTISLFPIGSSLALGDGRVARVLRTNPADYTRPTVEAWQPTELDAPPKIIDLAKHSELAIVKPLSGLQTLAA